MNVLGAGMGTTMTTAQQGLNGGVSKIIEEDDSENKSNYSSFVDQEINDMFTQNDGTPSYASEVSRKSNQKEHCPAGTPISFVKVVYWTTGGRQHVADIVTQVQASFLKDKDQAHDEKSKNRKFSVFETGADDIIEHLQKEWVVICGDDHGHIFQHRITSLLHKSGCLNHVFRPRVSLVNYCYQQCRRFNIFEGCDRSRSEDLMSMLNNPIGSNQVNLSIGLQGITYARDIQTTRFCNVNPAVRIQHIVVLQDFTENLCPRVPSSIIVSTHLGMVLLYSWRTGKRLGHMTDAVTVVHGKGMHVEDEEGDDDEEPEFEDEDYDNIELLALHAADVVPQVDKKKEAKKVEVARKHRIGWKFPEIQRSTQHIVKSMTRYVLD